MHDILLKGKLKLGLPEMLLPLYLPGHLGCCWPSLLWRGRSCMQRAPAEPGAPCTVPRSIRWPQIPGRNKAAEGNTYKSLKRETYKKAFQSLSLYTFILESLLTSFILLFWQRKSACKACSLSILSKSIRLPFVSFTSPVSGELQGHEHKVTLKALFTPSWDPLKPESPLSLVLAPNRRTYRGKPVPLHQTLIARGSFTGQTRVSSSCATGAIQPTCHSIGDEQQMHLHH